MKKIRPTYHSFGIVLGNAWGGGIIGYAATVYYANSYKEIMKLNKDALEDGSLDSGMGFKSLIGAKITIVKTCGYSVREEVFTSRKYITRFIGRLTSKQKEWLAGI